MKLSGYFGGMLAIAAVLGIAGCSSTNEPPSPKIEASEVFKQMQEDFKRMKDPKSSIKMMREYALEKLPNATDEELTLLMGPPIVKPNFDGTMYAFFWGRKYGKGVQVLSTPPPCRPIEVFRARRPYFP